MKSTPYRVLALCIALLLMVQIFPVSVLAQDRSDSQASENTISEATPADASSSSAPANSPPSGDTSSAASEPEDPEPNTPYTNDALLVNGQTSAPATDRTDAPAQQASYTITVDLNGGQVNSMQTAGWTQSSYQTYQWSRTVTEGTAGQGIALLPDDTLGGLLPGQPYRAGYRFTGWQIDGQPYEMSASAVTIHADAHIQAQWEIALYTVKFQSSNPDAPLWEITMPYGATLWTQPDAPWTDDTLSWTDQQTAAVTISLGDTTYNDVTVTRHPTQNGTDSLYYYTFTIENTFYFTYGGPTPEKANQHFSAWKLTSGGTGDTILQDAVFTPQFQAETSYVFNIYYYYKDGTKAGATTTVTKTAQDIQNGTLSFSVSIPEIPHFTGTLQPSTGISFDERSLTVTVSVSDAFGNADDSATHFLALTVLYVSSSIQYTIQYYQQPVGVTDLNQYTPVGTIQGTANYGQTITVPDRPSLSDAVSFEGFLASAVSQTYVSGGVTLLENTAHVSFDATGNATVSIYYDRSSYFIYFQTGTSEAQLDPIKVQYGAPLPDNLEDQLKTLTRTGYKAVSMNCVSWHYLDDSGQLQEMSPTVSPSTCMPAHDLYAVVNWQPDTTSIRLVYWVESQDSASFQNEYTLTVSDIVTESILTVQLDGTSPTISNIGQHDGSTIVQEGFETLIRSHYGEDYTSFFSYSAANTKASPGNVANAEATGSGIVQNGAITGNSYQVKVNGDGSTTINIYYLRNLYTLEFVLARETGSGTIQVATNTPGTFSTSGWKDTQGTTFSFSGFSDGVTATAAGNTAYGDMQVETIYRLSDAMVRDTRSPVGRYGTRTIRDNTGTAYTCYVYTLTARFEADVAALWPTAQNISAIYNGTKYISMGTAADSYYRNVFATTVQKNILNAYSTMDQKVLSKGTSQTAWTATADPGDGTIAHQMVAYWADNASEYHYYFLYETLDTSVTPNDADVMAFWPSAIEGEGSTPPSGIADGTLVKTVADGYTHVYVFDNAFAIQNSTSDKNGQNQPARKGFTATCKVIYNGTGDNKGGNIYFFYTREDYSLHIQNINGSYALPHSLLTQTFPCLTDYKQNAQTLRQLGWESVEADGMAILRYGAYLAPMGEAEIIEWLTSPTGGGLAYPYQSVGESQYYFSYWFKNINQDVPIDWANDNEMMTAHASLTLYAGWFTPRYTTTYTLNGGVWSDDIHYTLSMETLEGETVFFYYPHQNAQNNQTNIPLYWYVQSKDDDRLYVDALYVCNVHDALAWDASRNHFAFTGKIKTIEELMQISSLDLSGSRLVNYYYCYMGAGGIYSHNVHVNINATVNTVLEQPADPIRNGYAFSGWFYFDSEPVNGQKTYLRDVLPENQSLTSYGDGYVYLTHTQDAYLLYADAQGELYFYPEQTGYRFSYSNNASVVSRDLQLHAAWTPTGDATATIYHLVPTGDVTNQTQFTPRGGSPISVDTASSITIGGASYYILEQESVPNLYTGNTYHQTAREYYTDQSGRKWLPVQAYIDLHADQRTQTVQPDQLDTIDGYTYRVAGDDGSYTYYAFFVYGATNEVTYNIYAIDLAVAVAEGALSTYQDTFDRTFAVDPAAPYLLEKQQKSVPIDDSITTTVLTENAPAISGYTVYQDWSQVLQLQTDTTANNIFFYYVKNSNTTNYTITYYFMRDGGYSAENAVTFRNIPAVGGEILSLRDMAQTYQRLVTQAQTYSGYADSANTAQNDLYTRYSQMTVAWTQDGAETSFTVDTTDTDMLDLSRIADLYLDYYVDSWSPTGSTVMVSSDTEVEVYLAAAQLTVQKTDTSQLPLAGAKFTLQRLVADAAGSISYNGKTYTIDTSFAPVEAISGTDGKAVFYDLSARVWEDGSGYLYQLTETEAPKGYNRLAEPMYVTAPCTVAGETHYSVTYTVVNTGIAYMPKSGVFGGVYTAVFLGIGLMAAAISYAVVIGCRRKTLSGGAVKGRHTLRH